MPRRRLIATRRGCTLLLRFNYLTRSGWLLFGRFTTRHGSSFGNRQKFLNRKNRAIAKSRGTARGHGEISLFRGQGPLDQHLRATRQWLFSVQ